jgi:endonuclease/exonuclease/phosphatase family metal-dependent hydrolase
MRILTFNLRHDADRWNDRFPLVVKMLRDEKPDIIAFQEVALEIQQAGIICEEINHHTNGPEYELFVEPKWGIKPREGIALLSRLPVKEAQRLNLPIGRRVAQRISLSVGEMIVDIYNTHLHHLPPLNETIRLRQAKSLLRWIHVQTQRNHPAILMGDFNATPDSSTITLVKSYFLSGYQQFNQTEPVSTFPTPLVKVNFPKTVIDYIFLQPGLFTIQDARLTGTTAHTDDPTLYPSDHYGIVMDISI